MSSTIPAASVPTAAPASSVRAARLQGLVVTGAGLVLTGLVAAFVHQFRKADGSFGGEFLTEAVAAALGYVVAFALGWWRPRHSAAPRTSAERTATVLVVLGALLVPVCFWNPMPLTFAASAALMSRWGQGRAGRTVPALVRVVPVVAVLVVVAQAVALVVHVAGIPGK